jgi:hypothetical protein
MSRRLLVLNVVLGIVSIALAAGIVRTLTVRRALPAMAAPPAVTVPPQATASDSADPGLSSFAVITARNPFSPGRNEMAVATAASVAKPILHGVVIDGAKSRAFLEDPAAKRVAGYSVGDMIGGGRIHQITDDKVVIERPEGLLEILLQDPSKPKAPTVIAAPGQPSPAGAVAQPVAVPGAPPGAPPVAPTVSPAAAPASPPLTPPQFRRRVPVQGEPGHD